MMIMIDETSSILVNKRRIAPIRRVSRLNPASGEKPNQEDRPFGVVDRVTISKAALEKNQHLQNQVDAVASTYLTSPEKPYGAAISRLMTYRQSISIPYSQQRQDVHPEECRKVISCRAAAAAAGSSRPA
jgi:hypothetical protein